MQFLGGGPHDCAGGCDGCVRQTTLKGKMRRVKHHKESTIFSLFDTFWHLIVQKKRSDMDRFLWSQESQTKNGGRTRSTSSAGRWQWKRNHWLRPVSFGAKGSMVLCKVCFSGSSGSIDQHSRARQCKEFLLWSGSLLVLDGWMANTGKNLRLLGTSTSR